MTKKKHHQKETQDQLKAMFVVKMVFFTPSCASSFGVYDTVNFQGENQPYSSWEESIFYRSDRNYYSFLLEKKIKNLGSFGKYQMPVKLNTLLIT